LKGFLSDPPTGLGSEIDALLFYLKDMSAEETLADDFSMLKVRFE